MIGDGRFYVIDWAYVPQRLESRISIGARGGRVALDEFVKAIDGMATIEIKDVIFNPPATVVLWKDGTKTVVKCQDGDEFSKEKGLAMAICKKAFGNKGRYNEVFKKWCE